MNLTAQISLFNTVSLNEKFLFSRQLAVMLHSGIPINESLEDLATQNSNPYFKSVLSKVAKDINNGTTMEKAISKFPNVFDKFFCYMIKTGEESGTLEGSLKYLAEQLGKDAQFRTKVASASLYPSLIIGTALVVGGGVSLFVLPKMIDLFSSLDTALPLSTKVLIWLANFMKDYSVLIVGGVFLFLVIFRLGLKSDWFRFYWESLTMKVPYLGVLYRNIQLSQLCRNLGVMLKSGLPIAGALETQRDATDNLVFKDYINKLVLGIKNGDTIEKTINSQKMIFIPNLTSRMIAVGEKSGNLEESLNYLGEYYEEEVENSAKNLTSILEPILLIIIGLLVAFVAMAIISPIYQFTGSIK